MIMSLEITNLHKSFGETHALAGVSFDVAKGEIIAVLGPSGCGKSTLLSLIAGLETPDKGIVRWDGGDLANIPSHKRGFGLMFQDYALFPHKNVFDNVSFGLQMAGLDKDQIKARVQDTLELVGLPAFGGRDVNNLSGGEQQRVALARSLAPNPKLLMLDEPLGSLDRALRERLLKDLRSILQNAGQTTLYVTHDQEEAFALADRVVVMNAGRVVQIGTPHEIYHHPESVFVAKFIGLTNIFPGQAVPKGKGSIIDTLIGKIPFPKQLTGSVQVLIRPDAVTLNNEEGFQLSGVVRTITFRGGLTRVAVDVNGIELSFEFGSNVTLPQVGESVVLGFDPQEAIKVFEWTGQFL